MTADAQPTPDEEAAINRFMPRSVAFSCLH